MKGTALVLLDLQARRRRVALLVAFAFVFFAAAVVARVAGGHEGHVEFDRLFQIGGYPLISGMLLIGWLLGRFGMIAAFVMLAGVCSSDRADGTARLLQARPGSPVTIYLARFFARALVAFVIAALLMPLFDFVMLGRWAGPMTFALIGTYVLLFGALTFLLSVWTRADAWIAVLLSMLAMVWYSLRRGDLLAGVAPGLREIITVLLPPHGAILEIEQAYAQELAMPWDAAMIVLVYAALALLLGCVGLTRREV